jgi:uncharacterized membrane protein
MDKPRVPVRRDLAQTVAQPVDAGDRSERVVDRRRQRPDGYLDELIDGLCKITANWNPRLVHRDTRGCVRIVAADVRYERFVERAFDKIRQASRGMPAIMIRQLDALAKILSYATNDAQRAALLDQAEMIVRSSDDSVPEESDRRDVRRRYDLVALAAAS